MPKTDTARTPQGVRFSRVMKASAEIATDEARQKTKGPATTKELKGTLRPLVVAALMAGAATSACKKKMPEPTEVGVLIPQRGKWMALPQFEYNTAWGGFKGTERRQASRQDLPAIAAGTNLRLHGLQLKPQALRWGRDPRPRPPKTGGSQRWEADVDEQPVSVSFKDGGDYEVMTDKLANGPYGLLEVEGQYPVRGWFFVIVPRDALTNAAPERDYAGFAEETCACQDARCLEHVQRKYEKVIHDAKESMGSLSEMEKKAVVRAIGCMTAPPSSRTDGPKPYDEAREGVGRIAKTLTDYMESHKLERFPPSAPPVPREVPRGATYRSTDSDWVGTWLTIGLKLPSPQRYSYEIITSPIGTTATVRARGDLDGDGVTSQFDCSMVVANGAVTVAPRFDEQNPEE